MSLISGNGFPGRLTPESSMLHLFTVGTEPSCSVTAWCCLCPRPLGGLPGRTRDVTEVDWRRK